MKIGGANSRSRRVADPHGGVMLEALLALLLAVPVITGMNALAFYMNEQAALEESLRLASRSAGFLRQVINTEEAVEGQRTLADARAVIEQTLRTSLAGGRRRLTDYQIDVQPVFIYVPGKHLAFLRIRIQRPPVPLAGGWAFPTCLSGLAKLDLPTLQVGSSGWDVGSFIPLNSGGDPICPQRKKQ